jgi:hypothetical protein
LDFVVVGNNDSSALITKSEIISYFSGEFRTALDSIPSELLGMTQEELEQQRSPGSVDYFLRKNLWKQIDIAKKSGVTELTAASIYQGVCNVTTFHQKVIKTPIRLAWLLINPLSDIDRAEEALSFGLDRVRRDLLTMPMNEKTAPVILKAIELLWNRVKGPVVQRIEAKHAHLNMNKPIEASSPEDIIKKLDEYKSKLLEGKDVTPEEANRN